VVAWEAPAAVVAEAAAVVVAEAGHRTAACEVAVDAAMAGPAIKAIDRR
jgi:hypothetical protein